MQSVERSLRILEVIAEREPVGVAELARVLKLPKSTVQRSLTTLAGMDWLCPEPQGELTRWSLGPRARHLGRNSSSEVTLREAALRPMQNLHERTDETIHLAVPDELTEMVLIERMDSTQTVRSFNELGSRTPVTATATGRAILAMLTPEEVEEVIRSGLSEYLETTITDPDTFRGEIERVHHEGYAVVVDEFRSDVAAIGAAVTGKFRKPIAGVSISMPKSRFRPEGRSELGTLVRGCADEISSQLSFTSGKQGAR